MNSDFLNYVIYLIGIAIIIFSIAIIIKNKKKSKKKIVVNSDVIEQGTISAFFDKEQNLIVIPYSKDKYGKGRAVGKPQFLKMPYNSSVLGNFVKGCLKLCKTEAVCDDVQLMSLLESKDWKTFSQGKRNVAIHFKEGYGLVFNSTRRNVDGAYQFNHFGFEKIVDPEISDVDLGNGLLEILKKSK